MLEVGNNVFTIPEEQTHFSLWAILKSPLVIGAALNDTLTSINAESLAILKNKDVIAFNQDSLGVAANLTRRWSDEGYDIWSGPLSGNRTVVALVNWNDSELDASFDLPNVGLQSAGYVKDIWNNLTSRNVQTTYKKRVASHGTLLLELGETTSAGHYAADAQGKDQHTTTFSNVYGQTFSSLYNLTIAFASPSYRSFTVKVTSSATNSSTTHIVPSTATNITLPVTLLASNANTISISSWKAPTYVQVNPPKGTFYPSTAFTVSGTATHDSCTLEMCQPVGAKIGNITPSGGASIAIPFSQNSSAPSPWSSSHYVQLVYTNNDVALSTAWSTGRNARNLTISVNGIVTRLEVPLSARSSELFSSMKGWGDSASLGVLTQGWGSNGTQEADTVMIGNVGGEQGVQKFAADFVGMWVY